MLPHYHEFRPVYVQLVIDYQHYALSSDQQHAQTDVKDLVKVAYILSMPRYYYHLKFELYPTDKPDEAIVASSDRAEIHLPPPGTDIFTYDFPAHGYDPSFSSVQAVDLDYTGREAAFDHSFGQLDITDKPPLPELSQPSRRSLDVIDCGSAARTPHRSPTSSIYEDGVLPNRALTSPQQAVRDWRFAPVTILSIDMASSSNARDDHTSSRPTYHRGPSSRATITSPVDASSGINAGPRSTATKARFEPLVTNEGEQRTTRLGWGIVHLYRDGEQTPELDILNHAEPDNGTEDDGELPEDCTTLCIPAVPSYMTPSDFLGFVGEETREQVSHFRMVMTGKMNRYLVLMKFRDSEVAKRWRKEWDGKVFNGIGPENCHVMFIKSIVFQTPTTPTTEPSFPDTALDPFTPLKPLPPPTPDLVELPTCPVCLERMDDTTGLLTILCQHVFHCACLQKWKGSGCPVCRHTQQTNFSQSFRVDPTGESLCSVCDCTEDLWICLICGNVGCGRYKGGHAKRHWQETAHPFSLEIETQHVWDYAGDMWVHRLIQTKGDGKLVELPSSSRQDDSSMQEAQDNMDMVPRQKIENIGVEYTHMLSSQLESQRLYYEEIVTKAADKASQAASAADLANAKAEEALSLLREIRDENAKFKTETIPALEKDRDRAAARADKFSELARTMTKSFQEEKEVSKGLMQRIEHINTSMASMSKELGALKAENEDLKDQNRDLSFFISSQQKVQELEGDLGEEIREGTASVPEQKKKRRGKGKS